MTCLVMVEVQLVWVTSASATAYACHLVAIGDMFSTLSDFRITVPNHLYNMWYLSGQQVDYHSASLLLKNVERSSSAAT